MEDDLALIKEALDAALVGRHLMLALGSASSFSMSSASAAG
jgi:hypothetical protein